MYKGSEGEHRHAAAQTRSAPRTLTHTKHTPSNLRNSANGWSESSNFFEPCPQRSIWSSECWRVSTSLDCAASVACALAIERPLAPPRLELYWRCKSWLETAPPPAVGPPPAAPHASSSRPLWSDTATDRRQKSRDVSISILTNGCLNSRKAGKLKAKYGTELIVRKVWCMNWL